MFVLPVLIMAAVPAAAPIAMTPTAAPRQARLGGTQLLGVAAEAERVGDARFAERAYHALLADRQSAVRNEARFRLAKIHAGRRQWSASALLLRRILDDEPSAVRVRLELAGMLEQLGDEAGARRELRAAQATRPPAPLARLIDRYAAALRDRRPFGAEIKVAIAPDSNINRATAEDRLETVLGDFTIDEPGRARSGIGVAVDGSAFGRLPVGESVTLLAQAGGRSVSYKDERFNRLTLVGRTGAQLSLGADRLSLTLAHQRHRLGGETALTTLGAEADWLHPLSSRMQGRLSASVARIDNRRNDLEDGDVVSLGGGLDLAFSPTAGLSLSISGSRRMASDPAYATRSVDAGIQGWHELGRFTFSASANAGWLRADERLALFPQRRRDRSWGFGVGVTSRHFSWQGLAPSLRLTIERTDSSLAIYDTRRRAIELGLTRAF